MSDDGDSFVAPIWLRLLGIDATVPSFSGQLLVSHLVWGVTLALLTYLGYELGAPRLSERIGYSP